VQLFDCSADGDYLLENLRADQERDQARSRACEKDTVASRSQSVPLFEPLEEIQRLLRLLCVVALVGMTGGVSTIVGKDELAGSAADVHSADHGFLDTLRNIVSSQARSFATCLT